MQIAASGGEQARTAGALGQPAEHTLDARTGLTDARALRGEGLKSSLQRTQGRRVVGDPRVVLHGDVQLPETVGAGLHPGRVGR